MRRASFPFLLVLLALVAGGCGLLGGFGDPSDAGGGADVRATIETMRVAGESKDGETIAMHLATSIVAQILDGETESPQAVMDGDEDLLDRLQTVWEDINIQNIEIEVGELTVFGGQAEAAGSFSIDFEDPLGQFVQCTGYGAATFEFQDGVWKVTSVAVSEGSCLVNGEEPDLEPPVDEGEERPGEDEEEDGDLDLEQAPNYSFKICEYLVPGSSGDQTVALQASLRYLGYDVGPADGDYGPRTTAALKAFQRDAGIIVDGEFGPQTYGALKAALAARGASFECGTVESKPKRSGNTVLSMSALRKGTAFETPVYIYQGAAPGPTLVFVGCIHGNERSGHLAMMDAINKGITIDKGRLIMIPAINKIACEQNRRTMNRSSSAYHGKDFNRMFPVGKSPSYAIAKEMWNLLRNQPNLAFVVDFHDGFVNSLANTLLHTRQSKAASVARKIRDSLNRIRPSGARGPKWRAFSEPISGSLARKVGRDLNTPAILAELAGRNPGDPLSLRKQYAWTIIKMLGQEFGMKINF